MINARAETLAEKPAYKGIFRKHRCLIPMDGFYEWKAGTADGPTDGQGQAGQAADVLPERRRRAAGRRRAVDGVARPGGRGQGRVAALDDGDHDLGERDDAPGPRPDAGDPAEVAVGRVARPGQPRHRPPRPTAAARRRRRADGPPREHRRQQRPQQRPGADRARSRTESVQVAAHLNPARRRGAERGSPRRPTSSSAGSTGVAALAKSSWRIEVVGITWTWACGTS